MSDLQALTDPWARLVQSPRGRGFRALGHREFRTVWSTFIVGQLGFWISFISLQVLMARLTDSDGGWLGLLFFTNFIPTLLFTPVAGVVADRVERKRILIVGYTLLSTLMSVLAVLALTDHVSPFVLLPFAFATGTIFAFNSPASQSIVASSVPPADVPSAVSLQAVGANASRVVGPTLAAPVLAVWDEGAAFAIYGIACVVVVVLLRRLELTPYTPEHDTGGLWSRLRGGIDHARERPPALAALSLLCVSSLSSAAYLAVLPLVASEVFEQGARGFTILAAATGAGSMAGALTTGFRAGQPTMRAAAFVVACFGLSMILFALAPSWPLALVTIAVVGAFYFSGMTTLNTLLQSLADDAKRGRIMSLFVVGWAGLLPLGALWQGAVAEAHGVRTALALAGAITASYAGIAYVIGRYRASGGPTTRPGRRSP